MGNGQGMKRCGGAESGMCLIISWLAAEGSRRFNLLFCRTAALEDILCFEEVLGSTVSAQSSSGVQVGESGNIPEVFRAEWRYGLVIRTGGVGGLSSSSSPADARSSEESPASLVGGYTPILLPSRQFALRYPPSAARGGDLARAAG